MKIILLALVTFSCTFFSFSQNIYSKDGVLLGTKDEFMSTCVGAAEAKLMELDGVTVNTEDYCSCVCDALMPTISSSELEEAAKNDDILGLILNDKNLSIIMQCVEGNFEVDDDFNYGDIANDGVTTVVAIKACVSEIMNDPENLAEWTEKQANDYCECALEKLVSEGYTYGDLKDIENMDSEAFNEIVIPCFPDDTGTSDLEVPIEIIGNSTSSSIPIIDYFGQGYKLKLEIGGVVKYFLLDTGASDLIISRDLESELIENGSIDEDDYLGTELYSMANNELIEAKLVRLDSIKIGDYTVKNVVAAIIEGGSLLCGKSFLDSFSNWELKNDEKVLILYR